MFVVFQVDNTVLLHHCILKSKHETEWHDDIIPSLAMSHYYHFLIFHYYVSYITSLYVCATRQYCC